MSATLDLLNSIQHSFVGQTVAKSNHFVGITSQVLHVLGFVVLLSSVALVNLRLLGYGLRGESAQQISAETNRLVWGGFAFAVVSGIAMFFSFVELYYFNHAFQLKIVLLLLALAVQLTLFRKVIKAENPDPSLAKISAVLSIGLWFGVGLAGRAIGYV